MRLDVVRVRVAALFVVSQDHVRPEFADRAHQRLSRHLEGLQRETTLRQRGQRIPLGQPRINESEELLVHAEDLAGPGHLPTPDSGQVFPHVGPLHGLIQDVPALTAGQRGHHDLCAFADVAGHGGGALARLVVRMGVDRHQT